MNYAHKMDIPLMEQLRRQTISPEPQKYRQINFHRKITSSQIEVAVPNNHIIQKKLSKQMSMQGLQQLLKTSPYNKLIQQKSQSQLLAQESFSQQYLKDTTPNQQASLQQNFFQKIALSQNSTLSSSVKPRIRDTSTQKEKQILSHRNKDKQIISQLQQLLLRTKSLLGQYESEIQRHIKEKQELVKQIQELEH